MKYLLKIYNEVVDDASHYKKLYKSIQDYQLDLEDTFQKYINVISSVSAQFRGVPKTYFQNPIARIPEG